MVKKRKKGTSAVETAVEALCDNKKRMLLSDYISFFKLVKDEHGVDKHCKNNNYNHTVHDTCLKFDKNNI